MSHLAIKNIKEYDLYGFELTALQQEYNLLAVSEDALYRQQLAEELAAIRQLREDFDALQASEALKKATSIEEGIERKLVTPFARLAWSVLLGIGIILQETLPIAAAVLKPFLFPVHFVIDGSRNLWDLRRMWRDKTLAQRKVKLGTTVFILAALVVASVLTALAVSNPFALPVVFLGLVGAGLVKDLDALKHNKVAMGDLKQQSAETAEKISRLNKALTQPNLLNKPLLQAQLRSQEAKQARLNGQLSTLRRERSELRRGLVLNTGATIAVGLLITAAILSLAFPPAAAGILGLGMLVFAAVTITGVLTSPPVVAKMSKAWQWCKKKLGFKSSNDYRPVPSHDLQNEHSHNAVSEVTYSPLQEGNAHAPALQASSNGSTSQTSVSTASLTDTASESVSRNNVVPLPEPRFRLRSTSLSQPRPDSQKLMQRSHSVPNFFQPAQNAQSSLGQVVPIKQNQRDVDSLSTLKGLGNGPLYSVKL